MNNSVFYAASYHPIQAGSIDGTDVLPHDNAVYRALISSSAGLYDPFGDPKVTGDPYCSLFVGRLSHFTTEDTIRKAMEKYGRVKDLRLVRHIVTGASRGYAFVEFETERDMRRAYEEAHHTFIDESEIMVDYNRQQLMPGWIPRRLGGGLGGRKESGQLRFGGRERPFRAPLRPIPYEELKRLGIPPPPEGKYMSRFQVPSPPRRDRSLMEKRDMDPDRTDVEHSSRRYSVEREKSSRRSMDRNCHLHHISRREAEDHSEDKDEHKDRIHHSKKRHSDDKGHSTKSSVDAEDNLTRNHEEEHSYSRRNKDRDRHTSRSRTNEKNERINRSSKDRNEHSSRRSKDDRSRSRKRSRDDKTRSSKGSGDHKESSRKHHRHSSTTYSHHKKHQDDIMSP